MARRRAATEAAGSLSQRDQDLLKISRLLAEKQAPCQTPDEVPEAEAPPLIDITELAEAGAGLRPPRRRRPAGRSYPLLWRVLEVLIILVVVVWVFLLGVLVGRSRLGENGQGLFGRLERKIEAPTVILNLVPGARPVSPPGPPVTAAPPFYPAPSPAAAAVEFDEPETEESEEVFDADPRPAPEDDIPEVPAAAPERLFSVQAVLAFSESEARGLAARLETQGFAAYFYQSAGRFPVRVGPFTSRAEAEEVRRRLESLGYNRPYISELQP